jgi:hypothetical protein
VGTVFGWILAWFIDNSYRKRRAKQQADYIMLTHERDWAEEEEDDDPASVGRERWSSNNAMAARHGGELV